MKHSTSVLCAVLVLLSAQFALAQDVDEPSPRQSVYLELGGPGIAYSVNYERFIGPHWSIRAGGSVFSLVESETRDAMTAFVAPVTGQYLFFDGAHHLELGGGLHAGMFRSTLNTYGQAETFGLIAATGVAGYRYQQPDGGWLFRATFTPIYWGERFAILGSALQVWGSLSLGYAF
ncbi:MAG: hypothetical protein ACQEVA_19205 [Myxococcota bacterium]